jgi:hypothetical protein
MNGRRAIMHSIILMYAVLPDVLSHEVEFNNKQKMKMDKQSPIPSFPLMIAETLKVI